MKVSPLPMKPDDKNCFYSTVDGCDTVRRPPTRTVQFVSPQQPAGPKVGRTASPPRAGGTGFRRRTRGISRRSPRQPPQRFSRTYTSRKPTS